MAERKYKNPYQEYTDGTDVGADKLLLSAAQQAEINQYKADWQKASDAGDQAGMDAAHKGAQGVRAQAGYSGGANGGAYNPFADDGDSGVHMSSTHTTSPQWTSVYDKQRADTLAQIQNRAPFSYDPEKDPTYQQYKQQYERGAAKAMQAAMGQVAARTGGLASSYAQVAGQQSYNAYMAQLADKVPELRQLAYQMYMDEGDRLRSDLQMYDSLDSSDASRWATTVLNPYQTDRAFAFQQEQAMRDAAQQAWENQRWQTQYDDSRGDVAWERARTERLDAESARQQTIADAINQFQYAGDAAGMQGLGWNTENALRQLAMEMQGQELSNALTQKQIANYGKTSSGGGGTTEKPVLTYDQTMKAIAAGNITPNVVAAYEYYMGEAYGGGGENPKDNTVYQELGRKLTELEAEWATKWGARDGKFNDKVVDAVEEAQKYGLSDELARHILAQYGIRG